MKNTGLWRIVALGVVVAVCCAVAGRNARAADEKKDAAADVKPAAVLSIDIPGIGAPVDPNRVIVDVDGVKLTQRDMDAQLKQMLNNPRMAGIPPEQLAQIRPKMEDTVKKNFIGRVVLVKEADRLKVEVTAEEIDKAIEQLKGRISPGANFEELLKESGLNLDTLKQEITRDMRIGKLLEQETAEKAKVSDPEIEKFYNEFRDQFRQPEQAHARHILFKFEPGADDKTKQEKKTAADAARKQLAEGADFAALAKEKSDCPSGKQGGDLGKFERGNMVKEFEDASFSQKLNEIGPVVETKFGYHIIQVLERTEAKDKTLAESRDEIVGYLKQRKQRAAVDGYLEELQAKAKITYPDETKPALQVGQVVALSPKKTDAGTHEPQATTTTNQKPSVNPTPRPSALASTPAGRPPETSTGRAQERDSRKPEAFILPRITSDAGDLFDEQNAPECSLSSIPVAGLPKDFSSQVDGFINWPKNFAPPKPSPYTDGDKERIVADGMFYTKVPSSMGEGGGLRCIGKFLLDKNLNPLGGIWDGKKDFAIHTILGKLTMFDYEFVSEEKAPLKFKITKDGYVHLEGKGTVKDIKTGKIHRLE